MHTASFRNRTMKSVCPRDDSGFIPVAPENEIRTECNGKCLQDCLEQLRLELIDLHHPSSEMILPSRHNNNDCPHPSRPPATGANPICLLMVAACSPNLVHVLAVFRVIDEDLTEKKHHDVGVALHNGQRFAWPRPCCGTHSTSACPFSEVPRGHTPRPCKPPAWQSQPRLNRSSQLIFELGPWDNGWNPIQTGIVVSDIGVRVPIYNLIHCLDCPRDNSQIGWITHH